MANTIGNSGGRGILGGSKFSSPPPRPSSTSAKGINSGGSAQVKKVQRSSLSDGSGSRKVALKALNTSDNQISCNSSGAILNLPEVDDLQIDFSLLEVVAPLRISLIPSPVLSIDNATKSTTGVVRLATDAEVIAELNEESVITPKSLALKLTNFPLKWEKIVDKPNSIESVEESVGGYEANITTASSVQIDSFPVSKYGSAKYFIQVRSPSHSASFEVLLTHNSTITSFTEFASVTTKPDNSYLGSVESSINGGFVYVRFVKDTGETNLTIKVFRVGIPV